MGLLFLDWSRHLERSAQLLCSGQFPRCHSGHTDCRVSGQQRDVTSGWVVTAAVSQSLSICRGVTTVDGLEKGKGKAVPLQAWSGPEGYMKLRLPDFMTTAQDGGKVVSLTYRLPLPPGNTPGTHFC